MRPEVDLPLANFSDSPLKTYRIKKSDSANFKEVPESRADEAVEEEEDPVVDNWFDRDEATNDISEEVKVRLSIKSSRDHVVDDSHMEYPIDFWYLLSLHLEPEQVGVFSLICRSSHSITLTQTFWRGLYSKLYLRHYHNNAQNMATLPDRLKQENMQRPKGMRACVARFLHHCHPPFLARRSLLSSLWPDPHLLVGRVCLVQWTRRQASKHVQVFFKLSDMRNTRGRIRPVIHENLEELIDDLSDIQHNSEEGNRVLQVVSAAWAQVPPVMGLKLHKVCLSVSHGMRFHKLKLSFGSPQLGGKECSSDQQGSTIHVVLDSVVKMRVLDWWHPLYPMDGEAVKI